MIRAVDPGASQGSTSPTLKDLSSPLYYQSNQLSQTCSSTPPPSFHTFSTDLNGIQTQLNQITDSDPMTTLIKNIVDQLVTYASSQSGDMNSNQATGLGCITKGLSNFFFANENSQMVDPQERKSFKANMTCIRTGVQTKNSELFNVGISNIGQMSLSQDPIGPLITKVVEGFKALLPTSTPPQEDVNLVENLSSIFINNMP